MGSLVGSSAAPCGAWFLDPDLAVGLTKIRQGAGAELPCRLRRGIAGRAPGSVCFIGTGGCRDIVS
jgi:hypothetical protein